MPELPDVSVYVECLEAHTKGATLERVRMANPFLLRTIDPPLSAAFGRPVRAIRRVGKRIVLALEGELFLVVHLMIAGRLKWAEPNAKVPGRYGLAAFDFSTGTLLFTEAGTKRRASLHVVAGEAALAAVDRGGIDPLTASVEEVAEALRRERHTLKRTLTDPRLFSGIGNAYSDEILHRARLSPFVHGTTLDDGEVARLASAMREVLGEWIERLRQEAQRANGWPPEVTAFRAEMAVHGKFRAPCPVCGTAVQRVVYAENEMDYCPSCQTGGKILADRSLSRLLGDDWPRNLDELEDAPGLSKRPEPAPSKASAAKRRATKK